MFRWMLILVFLLISKGYAKSQDFEQSTLISLDERGQALRDVLTKFEGQTDMSFRVESIIPRTDELLAKIVTVQCDEKPFWEAIDVLANAAGLRVHDFYRSTIVLKPKPKFQIPAGPVPVAASITQGPFQARLEKHEIFNQLDVVIRPEPGLGQPHVVSYDATVHFENGQSYEYQPKYLIWVYDISDEVSLRIELDDWPKGVAVRKIDVKANLQIGEAWRQVALPPIPQIASRETKVRDGIIRIERAGFEKKTNPKYDEYGVNLRLEGVEIAPDEQGLDRFFLVSPDGSLLKPYKEGVSRGESSNIKWNSIDLGFKPEDVEGDFETYRISILLEDGTKHVIGPFSEVSPDIVDAGSSQIAISRSRLDAGEFKLLNYGVRVHRDNVRLDVGQDSLLEPSGQGRASGYPHQMTLEFQTQGIKTRRSQWKLLVEAPTKVVDKTLTFTFENVEMPEE